MRLRVGGLALLAMLAAGQPVGAQVFLSAEPHPDFAVAPLFVSTSIARDGRPPRLTVFWNVSVPPESRRARPSHLLLLLPFAVAEPGPPQAGNATLAGYVTARGFTVDRQGALPVVAGTGPTWAPAGRRRRSAPRRS